MKKKTIGGVFGALALALAGLVAHNSGGGKAAPTAPTVADVACVVTTEAKAPIPGATCALDGQAGPTNQDGYLLFRAVPVGKVHLTVVADGYQPYSSSPSDYTISGNTDLPVTLDRARPVVTLSRIHTEGRFFVTDAGTFRPVFASALAILAKDPAQRAAVLDEDAALGFNGVRVFAGALAWAGQSPELARERLPVVLEEAAQRGLYVYVSAITDSGSGYDVEAHLRDVAAMCEQHVGCLLEIANEFYHPTQSKTVNDPAWLRAIAKKVVPVGLPWALGAAAVDEGDDYPGFGGAFSTAHLDRGRDKWNQVRRIREIAGLSEASRKPAMSGEPIGAAEVAQPGRRENDPAFYFALGALSRLFEVGSVFHSDDGLNAQLLGPVQRQCAEAFVAGFRSIASESRLTYQNHGWSTSPVAKIDGLVRAYSGVAGAEGWNVALGVTSASAITWQNGWRESAVAGERPGVRVLRLTR